jgi:hypothetical protein
MSLQIDQTNSVSYESLMTRLEMTIKRHLSGPDREVILLYEGYTQHDGCGHDSLSRSVALDGVSPQNGPPLSLSFNLHVALGTTREGVADARNLRQIVYRSV